MNAHAREFVMVERQRLRERAERTIEDLIDLLDQLDGAAPALILPPAAAHAAANMARPRLADPQQRIDAAMNDIRAALAEMYPGFNVTCGVSLRDGSGSLALGAHPLKGYEVRHFFCDDPVGWSPLSAEAKSGG